MCLTLADVLPSLSIGGRAIAPTGDKVSRALPLANAAYNGTVFVVRGEWNETYLNALQAFDGTKKPLVNDLTDASSGAYGCLPSDFEISESFIDGVGNDPHAILDELQKIDNNPPTVVRGLSRYLLYINHTRPTWGAV